MQTLLTLLLLNTTCPVLANSVDPDQLASEGANWSGSAQFVIKYANFYQKPGSNNVISWKLEVGVAPLLIQQGKGYSARLIKWICTSWFTIPRMCTESKQVE